MTVQIDIDDRLASKIDSLIKDLRIDRSEYLRKLVEEDLVARQYAEAYRKNPIEPDEFEIEEKQMDQFWEQI